jgi:UDP-N-acetylmuramate dehydrogenase
MFSLDHAQRAVPLAPFTTFKIGGPADLFFEARSKESLAEAVKYAREQTLPYFILGTGANILITDKGFRGLVIRNCAERVSLRDTLLTAESGASIASLIDFTRQHQLSGFEHYAGIPSTVGGAMWQNLHFLSPDRSRTIFIAEITDLVTVLDAKNEIKVLNNAQMSFGYDDSLLHHQDLVVLEATFRLKVAPRDAIEAIVQANVAWRTEKHPPLSTQPSAGSIFRNIEGVGAGRLIDAAGLKGFTIGGAQVSEKHANMIINTGHASSTDVLNLITHIQKVVKQTTGHALTPEIGIVGEQ